MADLFNTGPVTGENNASMNGPLADRLRPKILEDVVGQTHLWGRTVRLDAWLRQENYLRLFYGGLRARARPQ